MPGSNGHRSRQMWEARGGVYVYMAEIAHAAVGGRRGHKPKDPHPIWDPKGGRFGAASWEPWRLGHIAAGVRPFDRLKKIGPWGLAFH